MGRDLGAGSGLVQATSNTAIHRPEPQLLGPAWVPGRGGKAQCPGANPPEALGSWDLQRRSPWDRDCSPLNPRPLGSREPSGSCGSCRGEGTSPTQARGDRCPLLGPGGDAQHPPRPPCRHPNPTPGTPAPGSRLREAWGKQEGRGGREGGGGEEGARSPGGPVEKRPTAPPLTPGPSPRTASRGSGAQ